MSKIAIISDIHANKLSLELVLRDIEKRNIDEIICLGDLVTKYFYPYEVVENIKNNCSIVIKGNCDYFVATDERYKFARTKLGIDNIDYLYNLPNSYTLKYYDKIIKFYHSSPNSLDKIFNPLFNGNIYTNYKNKTLYDYNEMFDKNDITIVGHTHQNYIAQENNYKLNIVDNYIFNNKRAIINVGSCGEHCHMILKDNKAVDIVDLYLSYAIIDNNNIYMVKIPYKETLKKVYFDNIKLQEQLLAPPSPNDTKKLKKALHL